MTVRTGTLAFVGPIMECDDLDPTDTLLMLALADHIDAEDQTFVGIQTLAARARCSYRTAQRRLRDLEERGYIVRKRRHQSATGNLSTYLTTLLRGPLGATTGQIGMLTTGHPGVMLTSGHQGVRTEVPSSEVPSKNKAASADADAPDELERQFDEHFWPAYPKTNGRKPEKAKALERWRKLSVEDRRAAVRGATNRSKHVEVTGEQPPYAQRYLRDRKWVDDQEPVRVDSVPSGSKPDIDDADAERRAADHRRRMAELTGMDIPA